MQNESYDIEKVREYFLYYIYSEMTQYVTRDQMNRITHEKYFIISEIIWGILLCGLFLGFFFWLSIVVFPIQSLFNLELIVVLVVWLIVWIISAWLTHYSWRMFDRARRYSKLNIYFSIKQSLQSSLSKLWQEMAVDIAIDGVNPVSIDDIQKMIHSVSKAYSLITWPLVEFQKSERYLGDEPKLVLEKFIKIETIWLTEYMKNFQYILKKWLENHIQELEQEKVSISKSENEVITLASTLLESHIQKLEKVRAQI